MHVVVAADWGVHANKMKIYANLSEMMINAGLSYISLLSVHPFTNTARFSQLELDCWLVFCNHAHGLRDIRVSVNSQYDLWMFSFISLWGCVLSHDISCVCLWCLITAKLRYLSEGVYHFFLKNSEKVLNSIDITGSSYSLERKKFAELNLTQEIHSDKKKV